MQAAQTSTNRRLHPARRWIRRAFLIWALFSTLWLANSVRTQGVASSQLKDDALVAVQDSGDVLGFSHQFHRGNRGLIFFCGSGIAAEAYAPLLRPIAEAGFDVFIVRLPYRFAPFESSKFEALARARAVMARHPQIHDWVVAGHSLGGALAARFAANDPAAVAALVLIGTTHPKERDLSDLPMPVSKVYASNDRIAPVDRVMANQALLPATTEWIEVAGGNHSQFGHYGHQLFDGAATISREAQQAITRDALLNALRGAALG